MRFVNLWPASLAMVVLVALNNNKRLLMFSVGLLVAEGDMHQRQRKIMVHGGLIAESRVFADETNLCTRARRSDQLISGL